MDPLYHIVWDLVQQLKTVSMTVLSKVSPREVPA
ncbi:hypothetical protein Godav_028256 [Gossypium davidsonii]|uniref:Uncharacterized protein n=2 Tax=Gossypium TaxID=3633 RepID=A0A7J8RYQ0_GOSDV|nr:hypothetical protein [Gossypium davidsonii]MBA0660413.1 hypothetical protein [Gossypium klotzschianum]